MWTEERAGRLIYREKYRDPLSGRERTVSVTLDKPNRKRAAELLRKKIDAKTRERDDYTLGEVVEKYLTYKMKTVQESTYDRIASQWHVLTPLYGADNFLNRLTVTYLTDRLLSTGKSATTLNEYMRRTQAFLRWAYKREYLRDISLSDKLEPLPEPPRSEKVKDKYLESGELKALLAAFTDDAYRLATAILALSGLRIGEFIALDTSDVTNGKIDIYKNFKLHRKTIADHAKTSEGTRAVHVQAELQGYIDDLIKFMDKRKERLGIDVPYLWVDTNGERMQYDTYRKQLRVHSEKVLGRRITPHVLRHTQASLMAEHDVPLDVTQRRLGHANSAVTRRIYTHVTEVRKKRDAAIIDSVTLLD